MAHLDSVSTWVQKAMYIKLNLSKDVRKEVFTILLKASAGETPTEQGIRSFPAHI